MVPNCNQFFSPSSTEHSLPKGTFRNVDHWKRRKYLIVTMERAQVSHRRPAVNIIAAEYNSRVN